MRESDARHTGDVLRNDPGNQLGTLLQFWRQRLDPRRIPGVDLGRRRLKDGLTQAETARLTGVGLTWYRELEAGTAATVPDGFLQRLAMTLRLAESERVVLWRLAVGYPPPSTPLAVSEAIDDNIQEILDRMLPHPAYVTNTWWQIVAHNQPQEDWFPWIPYEPNTMRWAFLYPEARDQLVNWRDSWARPFLAQIRVAIASNPDVPELAQLRDDILAGNAEAREIWRKNESLVHPDGHVRRLRLPYHDQREVPVTIAALAPLRAPTMRLIVLLRSDRHIPAQRQGN